MAVSRFDVTTPRSAEECRALLAEGLEVTRWGGLVRQPIHITFSSAERFTARLDAGLVRGQLSPHESGARLVGRMVLPAEWPLVVGWLGLSVLLCGLTITFGTPTLGIVAFAVIVLLAYAAFFVGMRRKQAARAAGYEIVRVIETTFRGS